MPQRPATAVAGLFVFATRTMQIPAIARGKRYQLPRPPGSADALLLAHHALARKAAGQLLGVVTADAADAQRLADELPFFAPGLRVALFPDWETLPYDSFSPHQDLISERLATLWRVRSGDLDVVLLPASTALARLAPPSFVAGYTFHFKQKMRLDEAALKGQLTLAGYQHVSQVVSPGEYAVRGGLIDLYPMGSPVPYRVDLFGDEVDSIRAFDPDTQRSLYPVPEVRLLPGREFPMDEAARNAFRARWRERIEGDPAATASTRTSAPASPPPASSTTCRCSSRPRRRSSTTQAPTPRWCCTARSTRRCSSFWTDTRERHRFLQHDPERPILPPRSCSCASRTSSPAPPSTRR
jgi:transcription-repair coupling factor (superfamily II helicase)